MLTAAQIQQMYLSLNLLHPLQQQRLNLNLAVLIKILAKPMLLRQVVQAVLLIYGVIYNALKQQLISEDNPILSL